MTFFAGGGRPPYVYSMTVVNLTTGMQLDPSTGTLAGTAPTMPFDYTFVIHADDADGNRVSGQYAIPVR